MNIYIQQLIDVSITATIISTLVIVFKRILNADNSRIE